MPARIVLTVVLTLFSAWLCLRPDPPELELKKAIRAAQRGETHGQISQKALAFLNARAKDNGQNPPVV